MSDITARAKEALEGVTPGPWMWEGDNFTDQLRHCPHDTKWTDHGPDLMSEPLLVEHGGTVGVITSTGYDASSLSVTTADAEFIAAARTLVPELVAEVELARDLLRGCTHDSWSGDGTGRWRCDQCGADQGSQDVGEVRRQLKEAHAEVERLRGFAPRIRAFAEDNVFHGDMTPLAKRQWQKLADELEANDDR